MATKRWMISGLLVVLLTVVWWAAATSKSEAQATGSIRVSVDCNSDPERTIIFNSTTQALNLETWRLTSLYRPIAGIEPITLSGIVQPGSSITFSTGTGGPPGFDQQIYTNGEPSEGLRLTTPFGVLNVLCVRGSGDLPAVALPSLTPTPTVTPTPIPSTSPAGIQLWISTPPGSPGAVPSCPASGEWLLIYWGGIVTAIADASQACPTADRVWVRITDRWQAFSAANPGASDTFTVEQGTAAFIHGK